MFDVIIRLLEFSREAKLLLHVKVKAFFFFCNFPCSFVHWTSAAMSQDSATGGSSASGATPFCSFEGTISPRSIFRYVMIFHVTALINHFFT